MTFEQTSQIYGRTDGILAITPSLSPASAGDDEPTKHGSQPDAVDCADSAVSTDELHGTCINLGESNSDR